MSNPEGHSQDNETQLRSSVLNLSSRRLSIPERSLLEKGLKFIPTPKYIDLCEITKPIRDFTRKLMINKFFFAKNTMIKTPFTYKSNWCPPPSTLTPSIREITDRIFKRASKMQMRRETPNLPINEFAAIQTLRNDPDIVIKKADKGSATVILDRNDYIWEIDRQLANSKHYRKLDQPIYHNTSKQITKIIHRLANNKKISKKQVQYLTPAENPRPRHIYTLPKIHKSPESWSIPFQIPPGRPIISDVGSESYRISEYIDSFLAPLAAKHSSYLRDTTDFLEKIRHIKLPSNSFLATLDVESMYTNIDIKDGLKAVFNNFKANPNPSRPDLEILELLKLCLENNDFEFNGNWFLQISGTAMGKKFAPSYANIFMAEWEKAAFNSCQLLPLVYLRFLDDIFLIWTYSKDEFDQFIQTLNNFHPSVKLKATVSDNSVDFLDTTVFKGPMFRNTGILDTKVFFKSTDTHQLLHKSSFHPKHTFRGILKSQIIRFDRICSRNVDFQRATNTLFRVLRTRGYSKRLLRQIKNNTIANLDTKLHGVANAKPCNSSRCSTCPFFMETHIFKSHQTNQTFYIKQNLSCDSKNVIYLINCKKCGIQYVGQTSLTLRDRFTRHRFDIRHKANKTVSNHFNTSDHSISDCCITPIEYVVDQDKLTKREQYWILKLKSLMPGGLNLHEESEKLIPFVIKYNTKATQVSKLIKQGYNEIQQICPAIFSHKCITAYCRNKNLSDFIVRSKLKSESNSP